ncbi:hypothetical protein WA026_011221 [Henosepilachna vigintioctopunctata]|uniref:Uncharacterized protein n=1 Tax=Henosepilachna vigintioctopunctata TaxID=420089 RepID=A0AAW1U7A4_9CUCU
MAAGTCLGSAAFFGWILMSVCVTVAKAWKNVTVKSIHQFRSPEHIAKNQRTTGKGDILKPIGDSKGIITDG